MKKTGTTSMVYLQHQRSQKRSRIMPDLCLVCNRANSKVDRDGLVSCEACKRFFQRNFEDDNMLRCITGCHRCDITFQLGNVSCARCRFEKCANAGMKLKEPKVQDSSTSSTASSGALEEPLMEGFDALLKTSSPNWNFPAEPTHQSICMEQELNSMKESVIEFLKMLPGFRNNASDSNAHLLDTIATPIAILRLGAAANTCQKTLELFVTDDNTRQVVAKLIQKLDQEAPLSGEEIAHFTAICFYQRQHKLDSVVTTGQAITDGESAGEMAIQSELSFLSLMSTNGHSFSSAQQRLFHIGQIVSLAAEVMPHLS